MRATPSVNRTLISLAAVLLFITTLACNAIAPATSRPGVSGPGPTKEAGRPVATPTSTSEPPATVASTDAPAEATDVPPTPTMAPASEAEGVRIIAQGFGQVEGEVGWAFIVENPNPSFAAVEVDYAITFFDETGAVLGEDEWWIDVIAPGQTLGEADTYWLDEEGTVASFEAEVLTYDLKPLSPVPPLTFDTISQLEGEGWLAASGVLHNPLDRDLTDITISAVAYDAAGAIIGGGSSWLDFVLANGHTGTGAQVTADGDPARVELYAVSYESCFPAPATAEAPDGAVAPRITQQGFGQAGADVGLGFLLENPNDALTIEDVTWQYTLYAADRRVLAVGSGYVRFLAPGQILGIAENAYLTSDDAVADLEVQLLAGEYDTDTVGPNFTTEEIALEQDEYGSTTVTGIVVNPNDQSVTGLQVHAIVYDAAGAIIGGGWSYIEDIPANGRTPAEVYVALSDTAPPARAELYAVFSYGSEFE